MRNVVERFSLQKAASPTRDDRALARAGYRGQGPLTTYLFLRFVTPFVLFVLAFAYLSLTVFADRPLWMNAIYALFVGLLGAYLPVLLLKNQTIKRQLDQARPGPMRSI
jgi:tight adherence protein C